MTKTRLEAFSDGVIAILITIMVLELKIPRGGTWADLQPVLPMLLAYVLSFILVGIYWNNHHHLLHVAEKINGKVLWANLHLLFWLSVIPFVTAWVGTAPTAPLPTAIYGFVLLASGVAWLILTRLLIALHGPDSKLAKAIGSDTKGKISAVLYTSSIPLAFVHPYLSDALFVIVAGMWLIPDRRIEAHYAGTGSPS